MPTLYGSWQGTGYQARIYLTYSVTYSADHTQAIFSGTLGVEFGGSISDSVNTWSRSGDIGSASGSNVSYSIGSGGGLKAVTSFSGVQKYGDATANLTIDNVEGVGGGAISGSFTMDAGGLAPYWNPADYGQIASSAGGFTIGNLHAAGNGGTVNNVQLQYYGGGSQTVGSFNNVVVTGLTPGATYTYQLRPANNTYGWGAWGPWKTATCGSTIPSAPSEGWYFRDVTQTSAVVDGLANTFDGGSPIDLVLIRVNTTPTLSGYWDITGGWEAKAITGLTPGTTYYACVYVHNANGWSAATAWKSFTTLPGVSVNVGGVWKNAVPYVNVGGVWKPATRYVNVGGTWKS